MKVIIIFLTIILLMSCSHPDDENNEKMQESDIVLGYNNGVQNSDEYSSNVLLPFESSIDGNRNILRMEIENGVRYVWIEINGVRLRFVFDTGASSICLSPAEATVMYRQGTLRREDILGVQSFQDATGRISEGTRLSKLGIFYLRILKQRSSII